MATLDDLAFKYRSDKTPRLHHGYAPFYDAILAGRDIRKILEIGIGTATSYPNNYESSMAGIAGYQEGASLFMWEEFFPHAEIFALDIVEEILINRGRIKSFQCDQSKEASLAAAVEKIGTGFDLIVDDGSHVTAHQILTANYLVPRILAKGGLYIIEDVNDVNIIDSLQPPCELTPHFNSLIPDDRLVIIRG
jgi:hypothetical protein